MATKRKSMTKKTRFEVFKRDSFKCQYCGVSAPSVVLVVDHIDPISKNGADEMVNYITACQPCNAGKSDRVLSDTATVQKQKQQLDELNERREQLEMMLEWRNGLKEITETEVNAAVTAWHAHSIGWSLSEKGIRTIRMHLKKYGLQALLDAIETACLRYMKKEPDGSISGETVGGTFNKIGGVLNISDMPGDVQKLYYIKGILRNRMDYVPYQVIKELQNAVDCGVSIEDMTFEAKHARSWYQYSTWLNSAVEQLCG